jgi:hypothetical protein
VSGYEREIRDYIGYCRAAWKQLRGQLNTTYHPTAEGACKLIWHGGDLAEAAKIKAAFAKVTSGTRASA